MNDERDPPTGPENTRAGGTQEEPAREDSPEGSTMSRRDALKKGAYAAPAIMTIGSVPAFASSGSPGHCGGEGGRGSGDRPNGGNSGTGRGPRECSNGSGPPNSTDVSHGKSGERDTYSSDHRGQDYGRSDYGSSDYGLSKNGGDN